MASFRLDVIRQAFNSCVEYHPQDTDSEDDSSDDLFEDALSDCEDLKLSSSATGISCDKKTNSYTTSTTRSKKASESRPVDNEEYVDALEYAKGFNEIAQFFKHLNVAFAFVAQNLEASCENITEVVKLHEHQRHVSLEQALEYDETVDHKYEIVSCVLWLHRPLEFVIMLFRDLVNAPEEVSSSEIAKRCYAATLGQHHAWPIQQMVNVLLMTIPERKDVIHMMNIPNDDVAKSLLLSVSNAGEVVYDKVERLVKRLELNDK